MIGEIDNGRQKTRNHGYDVIARLSYLLIMITSQIHRQNPKLKSTGAGRYQLLSRWWDAYRKQLGLKDFSTRKWDGWYYQQMRRERFYYDWSWWYPSGNRRCGSNIWKPVAGAGYGQFERELTAWLQNSKKRAERSEIDVWAESPAIISLISPSSACHGLLIITVITPLKPGA